MSPDRAEEIALLLRARHPDLDPLELDPEQAEAVVAEVSGDADLLAPVLVAWERLIP